ncbi:MAG: proton-conducting transporter membrane subunit, partial [Polyangiaceae bacterium]
MTDTHAAIVHVELAPQLWSIAFFPFAAAVAVVYLGTTLASASGREKEGTMTLLTRVALGGPVLSLASLLFYAYELATRAPSSRYFLVHLGNLLRIGQLDANLDFALDPLSATLGIVVTLIGSAVLVLLTLRTNEGSWRLFARVDALIAAALVLLLADNLLFAFLGWGAIGALTSSLARASRETASRARRVSFTTSRVSDAAFLVATAVLFWNLGGTFSEGDYVPDLDARFAAISSISAPAPVTHLTPGAKGFVTLASYPGAVVFADDSHIPLMNGDAPARSPFVHQPVDAGMHTFRIHPGGGLEDSIVAHTRFAENADVDLVLVGATTSFREMRDQLAITDDHGATWRKDAIASRRAIGSLGAMTLACLLFVLAACARASAIPFDGTLADDSDAAGEPLAALLQAVVICSAAYVLARIAFLFELSPTASTIAACVGAPTALLSALAACAATTPARLFGHVATAHLGVALVAIAAGSPIAAVALVAVSSLALTAFGLIGGPSAGGSAAAGWISAGLAAAPVPGLGASYATARTVGAALGSDRFVYVPGGAIAVTTAGALGVVAFAIWKYMYITYKNEPKKAEKATKKESPARAAIAHASRLALGLC